MDEVAGRLVLNNTSAQQVLGCPQVQKRGPTPAAERPEPVLDAGSGPERRRRIPVRRLNR